MSGDIVGHKDTVFTLFEIRFLDFVAQNWACSSFKHILVILYTYLGGVMLVGAFLESKSDFRFWRQIQIFPEISSIHANIFGFKSKSEKRATLCTAHFL